MKKITLLLSITLCFYALEASAQNVGIGTNTPAKKLEINSGILNQSGLRLTQYASTATEVNVTDVVAEIPSVTGLAFDNSGNCYATNFSGNKIHKISPTGIVTDFVTTNLNGPHDIILGPDGNLYVSNYFGGTISKITLAGVITNFASNFSNPIGLAFDMNNFLFVVNNGNGQLSKVDPTGTFITYNFGTGLTSPYGCVYSATNDKIYISNYGANEIAEINFLAGGAKTTFKAGIDACTGINIDASANVYAAQAAPNKVVKITQAGVVTDYATTTYPFDITFNDGKLYMANQTTNKVSVLNAVSNFLAVDNKGDVVRVKAGNLLQPTGQAFKNSWTITGFNISNNNIGNVGIGNFNATKAKLVVDSDPSTITNAVFGSNGTGISLQKNWPAIGYNSYRDATNNQRYMANGLAMVTAVDQVNGTYFWNKMGTGLAGNLVGSNEQYIAGLTQTGSLDVRSLNVGGILNDLPSLPINSFRANGNVYMPIKVVSSDYIVQDGDYTINVELPSISGPAVTITMPDPYYNFGRVINVVKSGYEYRNVNVIDPTIPIITIFDTQIISKLESVSGLLSTNGIIYGTKRKCVTYQCTGSNPLNRKWIVISDDYYQY
jgi:streptogramin lyase